MHIHFFFLVYQEGMVNQETECNLSFLISIKAKKSNYIALISVERK